MAVLVFRHVLHEPCGRIGAVLDSRNIEWSYADLWKSSQEDVCVDRATGLIVMGGPMSVNDPLPWLRLEESYIRQAISARIPILGLCLGAQLLAKCLGARVSPLGRKEIGWHPIRLREPAWNDPLFSGLQPVELVFQWHGDTFGLPSGAEWLAENDLCPNQAFRYGSNCYGLQFHPEVTPQIIATWLQQDSACGDLREVEGLIDPEENQVTGGRIGDPFVRTLVRPFV